MRILVTGSGAGLGLAIAQTLRACGHTVLNYDLKDGMDVTRPPTNLAEQVEELDGLINCAGINCNEWFEDITLRSLANVMNVNAFSFVHMAQELLEPLKESKGFVLNIVSNASHMPMTSSLAYNASKAAAAMITRQMAHELTPKYGITVFSISPNKLAGTEMSKQIEDNVVATRGWSREYAAEYQKKSLMHGLETPPQAIADYISHLLQTGSWKYMSGTDIPFGK